MSTAMEGNNNDAQNQSLIEIKIPDTPNLNLKRPLPSSNTPCSPSAKRHNTGPSFKKYHWTPEEDDAIRCYVEKVGDKENVDWPKCSKHLQEETQFYRSANACRQRYNTHLGSLPVRRRLLAPASSINITSASRFAESHTTNTGASNTRRIQKVSCGIQTDITFSPSDEVVWASTKQQPEQSGNIPLQSTSNTAAIPSLRSLLISPIDELPDITPRKRKTEIPRKLLMSPLESRNSDCTPDNNETPSKTNSEKLQPVNCRTDELDHTQQESSSQEQTARKGKTPAPNSDHGYGKAKPQRRKKHNRVNPAAQELKTELECKSSAPVLTSHQQACFQLAVTGETSPENVASAVLSMPPLRDAIVDKLSEKLAKIPEKMRNRKHGKVSVLMRKGYDDMRKTNLVEIVREFQQEFPDLFKFVLSVMKGPKPLTPSDIQTLIPRIAMLYSIMLQTRVPDLSRLQRILTMALGEQICNQKVYDRLNVLGVTMSYPTLLDVTKTVAAHFKDELVRAIKDGQQLRLIGDNLNFRVGVTYENKFNHSHMVHMFGSCALLTTPVFVEKPEPPEIPLVNLTIDDVTLSAAEYAVMRRDLVSIVAPVLGKYLPQLQLWMKSVPALQPSHPEFAQQTTVIPLPVLPLNEQYEKDTIKILDYYETLVQELPVQTGEPTQIGGDQLTRERFGTSLKLRIGNRQHRFANLGPCTFEFFHLAMNYLDKAVFDILWGTDGDLEMGTLRGEKDRLDRKTVDSEVHKAYDAHKNFFQNYVNAHIVEAALHYYGMDDRNSLPTKNLPPENGTEEEKKAWAYHSVGELIDKYCMLHWSESEVQELVVDEETIEEQAVVVKLRDGAFLTVPTLQENITMKAGEPDKKKTHAHYVLEVGLTYLYLLQLCKTPDRLRLLALFKMMMQQLKGRSTHAKYPLEILKLLFQQYSLLGERRAHQVLHACFVNQRGQADTNIPADLQMEWIVKQNKQHIKHMYSNKTADNIVAKSSALPGLHTIAANFDSDAGAVIRAKRKNLKDNDRDEVQVMDDLRAIRPFDYQPGRAYRDRGLANLPISQAKNLSPLKFQEWFDGHKKALLLH